MHLPRHEDEELSEPQPRTDALIDGHGHMHVTSHITVEARGHKDGEGTGGGLRMNTTTCPSLGDEMISVAAAFVCVRLSDAQDRHCQDKREPGRAEDILCDARR